MSLSLNAGFDTPPSGEQASLSSINWFLFIGVDSGFNKSAKD